MEILNYFEQSALGPVVAIFSVTIPAMGMTFHQIKLIRTKKGGLMVAMPQYSKPQEDGTKTWHTYVELSETRRQEFNKKVMEAIKPFLSGDDFKP